MFVLKPFIVMAWKTCRDVCNRLILKIQSKSNLQ